MVANKNLKCYMRPAKGGGYYRTCKDIRDGKQVRKGGDKQRVKTKAPVKKAPVKKAPAKKAPAKKKTLAERIAITQAKQARKNKRMGMDKPAVFIQK